MADRPVGAAKIVLSLDPTNLEKQLVSINNKLVDGMTSIDNAYKAIGTKSGPAFEAMKANATAAMNAITASGKQSNEELIRIQQATALKIENITAQQYKAQEAARAKFQTSSAAYWTAEMKFEADARAKMQADSAAYWSAEMKFKADARAKMQAGSAAYWTAEMKFEADARAKMQASSAAYWTAEMKFEADARAKANAANAEYWLAKKKFDAEAKKEAEADSKAPWQTLGIRSTEAIKEEIAAVKAAAASQKAIYAQGSQDHINIARAETDKLKALHREMAGGHEMSMAAMTRAVLRFYAVWYVASTALNVVAAPFIKGFQAVNDYNMAVAESAAMIMTFAEKQNGLDIEGEWKRALGYATNLIPVLEKIAAKTVLSGKETIALSNAFARSGVILSPGNAGQMDAFTKISNALPMMTQGSEIMRQINTEIRSLMMGTNESTSMLLTTLKAIDPQIKEHLQTWRAQGTILEHIGDLLAGFGPAVGIIENQWGAVKTTLDTTVTQTLREGMKGAYEEIIDSVKLLNKTIEDNQTAIESWISGVSGAWAKLASVSMNAISMAIESQSLATRAEPFIRQGLIDAGEFINSSVEKQRVLVGSIEQSIKAMTGIKIVDPAKEAAIQAKKTSEEQTKEVEKLIAKLKEKATVLTKGEKAQLEDELATLKASDANKKLALSYQAIIDGAKNHNKETKVSNAEYKQREKSITDYIEKLQQEIDFIGLSAQAKERLEAREKGITGERLKSVDAMIAQKYASTAAWKAAEEASDAIEADDKKRAGAIDSIIDGLRKESAQLKLTTRDKLIYNMAENGVTSGVKFDTALKEFDEIEAAKTEVHEFTEEVSRLFETMQAGVDTGRSFGDGISEGVNNAVISMQSLTKMYDGLNAAQELSNKLASGEKFDNDPAKDIEERQKAAKKLAEYEANSTANQLSAYRQLFGTTSQLFKENSRERKAMSAIEQGLAAIEIALNIKKALVSAVGAVTAQGSVPVSGFAMAAAMAALMAGVLSQAGISFSGGGSGSSATTEAPVATNYSGTVLGDTTKSSESISNVTDLLESIHADEYPALQGIYREMVRLNNNITGLVSSILQNDSTFNSSVTSSDSIKSAIDSFTGSVSDGFNKVFSLFGDEIGGIMSKVDILTAGVTGLFTKYIGGVVSNILGGSKKTSTTASGYQINPTAAETVLQGGALDVGTYADYVTKKDGGWFGKTKYSYSTETGEASEDVKRLFTLIFANISDALLQVGESLGTDLQKVRDYVWDIGKIDLMDLTGDEINEKLETTISTASDTAAAALFEGIKQYQEIGEGLYETATRLVVDKEVVLQSLDAIGIAFSGVADSMAAVAFSESLLSISGDLETFVDSISGYFANFFTEAEQNAYAAEQLDKSLENLGVSTIPETREQFKALVQALDLTSASGQETFVALMSLQGAANDFYALIEKQNGTAKDLRESLSDQTATYILTDEELSIRGINATFTDTMASIEETFSAGSEVFAELAVKAAFVRDLSLEALRQEEMSANAKAASDATASVGTLVSAISDGITSIGMDEWESQTKAAQSATAGWNTQITELVAAGDMLPEQASLLYSRTAEWLDLTISGIEEAKAAQERQDKIDYTAFQFGIQGVTGNDATIANIASKRGWGTSYGDIGDFDLERLYTEQVLPFFNMSFEDFNASAELMGITYDELASDTSALASVFNTLSDEAESAGNTFSDISDSIRNQIYEMRTTSSNQRDVYERIGIQKSSISDYMGGDSIGGFLSGLGSDSEKADALSTLQGMFGDTLSLYQEGYQRPSMEYQAGYDETLGNLNSLLEYSDLMKSEYELQYEQTDYLRTIANNTASLANAEGGTQGETVINISIDASGGDSETVTNNILDKLPAALVALISRNSSVRVALQAAASGK